MDGRSQNPKPRRFWILIIAISAIDGIVLMSAYWLLYGYWGWANIFQPDLSMEGIPMLGLEFLLILLAIGSVNFFVAGWIFRLDFSVFLTVKKTWRLNATEIFLTVLSFQMGVLGAIIFINTFSEKTSIFDRGFGHLIAAMLGLAFVVFFIIPALIQGQEMSLKNPESNR